MVNSLLNFDEDWKLLRRAPAVRSKRIPMEGRVFTRLTVVSYLGKDKNRRAVWKCKCVCGNLKSVTSNALLTGQVKSCGCLMVEYQQSKRKT
jgi:hypothetical protein